MAEQTMFIVKPDAVARNMVGRIISRFEEKGFRILNLKMFTFSREQAERFYNVHKDKPFFGELTSFVTSGPAVAVIIEGNCAIAVARRIIGATNSVEAAPGSVRGDFGLGFSENIIHASDSQASFDYESRIAFE